MRSVKFCHYACLGIAMLGLTLLPSCSGDDSDESPKSEQPLAVTATVEHGNDYNSKIDSVKVEALNENTQNTLIITSARYVNGGFSLTLPYPLEEKYLAGNVVDMNQILSGVSVSDKTARAVAADFYGYKNGNKQEDANFILGGFVSSLSGTSLKFEVTQASIVYCDKPVKLTGSFTEELDGMNVTFTTDVSWSKGWNIVYFTQKGSINALTGIPSMTGSLTVNKPSYSMKWYCGDDFQQALNSGLGVSGLAASLNKLNKLKPALFRLEK